MSDSAIKLLAFVFWPLIVVLFGAVMALGLVAIVLAWPLVPFMRVDRTNKSIKLKL